MKKKIIEREPLLFLIGVNFLYFREPLEDRVLARKKYWILFEEASTSSCLGGLKSQRLQLSRIHGYDLKEKFPS